MICVIIDQWGSNTRASHIQIRTLFPKMVTIIDQGYRLQLVIVLFHEAVGEGGGAKDNEIRKYETH